MKITLIKQQIKRPGRYSVFIDGTYSFGLTTDALLDCKLVTGQEVNQKQIRELQQLSDDSRMYNNVLSYLAIRPRSRWEIETYLARKKASPSLSTIILNKLSINKLIDDQQFAAAFVRDRRLLRPTSRRKLILELRQKRVPAEVIESALSEEETVDSDVLRELLSRKRKQTKYQDDMKLMQYLARQGFGYGDIKEAMAQMDTS